MIHNFPYSVYVRGLYGSEPVIKATGDFMRALGAFNQLNRQGFHVTLYKGDDIYLRAHTETNSFSV